MLRNAMQFTWTAYKRKNMRRPQKHNRRKTKRPYRIESPFICPLAQIITINTAQRHTYSYISRISRISYVIIVLEFLDNSTTQIVVQSQHSTAQPRNSIAKQNYTLCKRKAANWKWNYVKCFWSWISKLLSFQCCANDLSAILKVSIFIRVGTICNKA